MCLSLFLMMGELRNSLSEVCLEWTPQLKLQQSFRVKQIQYLIEFSVDTPKTLKSISRTKSNRVGRVAETWQTFLLSNDVWWLCCQRDTAIQSIWNEIGSALNKQAIFMDYTEKMPCVCLELTTRVLDFSRSVRLINN